jgi:hypothetical protein
MDIVEAARYGWDKKSAIVMSLRSLTPEEFRSHSFLDGYLSDSDHPMIYQMNGREIIKKDSGSGDLVISHGHGECQVGIDATPILKKKRGYREFMLKAANRFGEGKVDYLESGIYDSIPGDLWKGAKVIGHAEISDLAEFFQQEFVERNKKKAATKIAVKYEKLTPAEILRMTYNPKNVFEFMVE